MQRLLSTFITVDKLFIFYIILRMLIEFFLSHPAISDSRFLRTRNDVPSVSAITRVDCVSHLYPGEDGGVLNRREGSLMGGGCAAPDFKP